jgi:hypothetical protein
VVTCSFILSVTLLLALSARIIALCECHDKKMFYIIIEKSKLNKAKNNTSAACNMNRKMQKTLTIHLHNVKMLVRILKNKYCFGRGALFMSKLPDMSGMEERSRKEIMPK